MDIKHDTAPEENVCGWYFTVFGLDILKYIVFHHPESFAFRIASANDCFPYTDILECYIVDTDIIYSSHCFLFSRLIY